MPHTSLNQHSDLIPETSQGKVLHLALLGPSIPHVNQVSGNNNVDDLDFSTSGESAKMSLFFSSLSSILLALSDSEKTCRSKRTM